MTTRSVSDRQRTAKVFECFTVFRHRSQVTGRRRLMLATCGVRRATNGKAETRCQKPYWKAVCNYFFAAFVVLLDRCSRSCTSHDGRAAPML